MANQAKHEMHKALSTLLSTYGDELVLEGLLESCEIQAGLVENVKKERSFQTAITEFANARHKLLSALAANELSLADGCDMAADFALDSDAG